MFFIDYRKTHSIWSETKEKWDDAHPSWKIVGENPTRIYKENAPNISKKDDFFSVDNLFVYSCIYYKIVYASGREGIVTSKNIIAPETHIIVEADRGEDCARIEEQLCTEQKGEIKNILRIATKKDVELLVLRKEQEDEALVRCIQLVKEQGYNMEITRCEMQWDMKKITFYFKSAKRVDFRELVKELFKYFKIRIWMSMENRYGC